MQVSMTRDENDANGPVGLPLTGEENTSSSTEIGNGHTDENHALRTPAHRKTHEITNQEAADDENDSIMKDQYHKSTMALCACILCHSYLLISPFPYSGFMAMDLVPNLTTENAGSYAGLISSTFMLGRVFTSYAWGTVADTYGRKFVLLTSLGSSAVLSLAFGLAPTYPIVLVVRLALGLCNGILGTVKTAVSELARGDHELETKGMGLVIGMWGWGFLVSPALSGALSEPVQQYPHAVWWKVGWFKTILQEHPFLLPNLVSFVVCALCMVAIVEYVEETLPEERRRSPRNIGKDVRRALRRGGRTFGRACRDLWQFRVPGRTARSSSGKLYVRHSTGNDLENGGGYDDVHRNYTDYKPVPTTNQNDNATPTNNHTNTHAANTNITNDDKDDDKDDDESDTKDDLKILQLKSCSELTSLLSSPSSRASYCSELHRHHGKHAPPANHGHAKHCVPPPYIQAPSHENGNSKTRGVSVGSTSTTSSHFNNSSDKKNTTIASLWSHKPTRHHLLISWFFSFVSISIDEAFPLFCLSKESGLGLSETQIGAILTGSGVVFVGCQYVVFAAVTKRLGLYKSLALGGVLSNPLVVLIPVSLWINGVNNGNGNGGLRVQTYVFLCLLMAVYRVLGSVYFAAMTIATNRTVDASRRATMNGLSVLGGSVAKALGPAFSGCLFAFSFSSTWFKGGRWMGSVFAFGCIGVLGLVASFLSCLLKDEEDVGDAEEEEKEEEEGRKGLEERQLGMLPKLEMRAKSQ